MRITAGFIAAFLSVSSMAAPAEQNTPLLQKAHQAYISAQTLEAALKERPETERTRDAYLKVISAYQRVYLITPHTGYADDSLIAIARLFEDIKSNTDAVKTLKFLIHDYPGTPFKQTAERDIARLNGDTAEKAYVVPSPSPSSPSPSSSPNPSSASPNLSSNTAKVQRASSVENLRYWETQNSVRIVVEVAGDITFNQGGAKDPPRVFIDLSAAKLNSVLVGKQWPVKSGLLQQIRIGQYDTSTVRIVLDVGIISRVTSFTLHDPDRLIIDVLGKEIITQSPPPAAVAPLTAVPLPSDAPKVAAVMPAARVPSTAASVPATTPTPAPTVPKGTTTTAKKVPETDTKVITAAKATNAGTRSLVRSLGLKLSRVVIDAGHGGHDTGTIGPAGYTEKELVLDVARRLKDLIENNIGAEVVMTRDDDSFVPLESRTAIANQQEADLFISIHANSSDVRSVRGVETYFLNFTSSREALETASRENASSERSIHELQDLVKKIMLRDKVDESRELAQHVEHALAVRKGSGLDRGVKQAPFIVLIGADMPSILAEICFISNPQDEKLVKIPENRQAIAESLFEGVRSYAESLSGTKTAKTQDKTQE